MIGAARLCPYCGVLVSTIHAVGPCKTIEQRDRCFQWKRGEDENEKSKT
jgi:hypothetical protein